MVACGNFDWERRENEEEEDARRKAQRKLEDSSMKRRGKIREECSFSHSDIIRLESE